MPEVKDTSKVDRGYDRFTPRIDPNYTGASLATPQEKSLVPNVKKSSPYTVGTGIYPNAGAGKIPQGSNIPPAPPSLQSSDPSRNYNRHVGTLDPRYSGASLATRQEKERARASINRTQKPVQDQFERQRMQQGGEQYDTFESYAADKFNPIPKMDLDTVQSTVEADFPREYDRHVSRFDPNYSKAFLSTELENITKKAPKFSDQSMMNAFNEIKSNKPFSSETQQIADYLKATILTSDGVSGDEGNIDAGVNTGYGTALGAFAAIAGAAQNVGVTAAVTQMLGLPTNNKAISDLYAMSKMAYFSSEAEANAYADEMDAAINSMTTSDPMDISGHAPSIETAGDAAGTSGVGSGDPSAGTSSSTGESTEGIGWKDGGEVRKYQDGSIEVGSIEPRIDPSQGSSSLGIDLINDPNKSSPSALKDDVLVKDEGNTGVKEGDVVFPPESVEVMGLLNMNDMIKAAIGLAFEVGAVVPADIDPNEKVPVKLTNGEVVIPKVVADALGKERVEEIINKGLKLRAQREEQAKAQQQAPQAAPQAPQAMPQGLKDGTMAARADIAMDDAIGVTAENQSINANSSIGKQMDSLLRGKTVDLPGTALDFNVGFDRYNAEDVIDIAKKVGAVLGNPTDGTNLLLETAAVESSMGETDRDINRASGEGFTIGPWQVTTTALNDINSRVGVRFHKGMAANIAKFKQYDWAKDIPFGKVTEDDLKDPLINAVYARLYYTLKEGDIPKTPEGRAKYWAKKYNTEEDIHGTPALYMKKFKEAQKLGYIK